MKIKTIKIISIFGIFLLSFLTHYGYDKFPNILTSFLFPVNESIFEHMKMIYTSYIIWEIVEYILLKKYSENIKNFPSSVFISVLFNIIFFLIIYIPIYNIFGHNLIITLIVYFISIFISQIISYKILTADKDLDFINKYSYLFLLIILMILIYLTYYPIKNDLFIDKMQNKIGLKNLY